VTFARRPHVARAITALTAAVGVAVLTPAAASAAPGPLGPADHDFLTKAHAAVAYAAAASELVKTNGGAAGVKTIGKQLAAQDKALDKSMRDIAVKLQIALPAGPAAGLDELKSVKGEQFDTVYVERVRAAEGGLLELAAAIRVHTRNTIVRDLAQRTATAMMTQIPLLESSGLIDFTALPAATVPATAAAHQPPGPAADPGMLAEARAGNGYLWPSIPVAGGVLAVGLLGALFGSRRIRGSRVRGSRRA
jgi:putative membrane protein